MYPTKRLLAPAVALTMLALLAPATAHAKADKGSWWECDQYLETSPQGTRSNMVRFLSKAGKVERVSYRMFGTRFRAFWKDAIGTDPVATFVDSISAEIPIHPARDGQGVWGYLFADGELVGTALMLDPKFARKGFGAGSAYFSGFAAPDKLDNADRWSFVAIEQDGTEIARLDLPVPDRAAREAQRARHRADLDEAWAGRSEEPDLLSPVPGEFKAWCVFSTPERRQQQALSEI